MTNWTIPKGIRRSWDRRVPYYLRVRDHFASLIEGGTIAPETKLPSERELSEIFRITRVTARQALIQLEMEGLIYRLNRRGWFVSPPRLRYNPSINASFTRNVRAHGRTPGTIVLSKEQITPSAWYREQLRIGAEDPVFLICRVRLIDGRPVLVEHLHINAKHCPGLLDIPLDGSLTELLERHYGIQLQRAAVRFRPSALNASQAQALGVAAGLPGLYLSRICFDQLNNVIEFDQEYWRHDALEVHVDVDVDESLDALVRTTREDTLESAPSRSASSTLDPTGRPS